MSRQLRGRLRVATEAARHFLLMGKGRGVDARTASFFAAVLTAFSAAIYLPPKGRRAPRRQRDTIARRAGLLRHLRRHQVPARTRNPKWWASCVGFPSTCST